ncbi:MAG: efflux RND transporter periplasmic adaptor subunit [Alphaproteobacteria bacterium]|nr:efflux RND transporter periplasmic adaptor subunit [Alphaproteobacteria bacterium]
MSKQMKIMLLIVAVLFGSIFLYKAFQGYMIGKYMSAPRPPATVSAVKVTSSPWQSHLSATGTLRAINGVDITSEIAGLIDTIAFTPGQTVNKGDLILELNRETEMAALKSLEAQAELAEINYNRDKEQFAVHAVSKAIVDTDEANLKSARAQVAQQKALIDKKIIRAPFKGRLGISAVNLGQYLNPGDKIVTLQSLDPIYVDFTFPQQDLPQLTPGQPVSLTTDAFPGVTFQGKITSLNPKVDPVTRNVEVEATLQNPHQKLFPGMFGLVEINTGSPQVFLTVPQEAISYNSYGALVFILKEKEKNAKGETIYSATQQFVTVGKTRENQIQILKGLVEGDHIVTAGQLKLKNGSLVVINNSTKIKND